MRTGRFRYPIVAIALLSVALVVFRDFVFGEKLLLYKDIGDDSLNFHYPYFVLLSEYLRSNGFPGWSFRVGMGQSIFPYSNSLLFDPVVWLTRDLIARALIYQHLLKVVVCGLFFFRFLELKGLKFVASLLGALLVALSAYMTMGSCWTLIGNEVVCLTFVLFAVETAIVKGRWFYLPLAIACCGILTSGSSLFRRVATGDLCAGATVRPRTGRISDPARKLCLKLAAFAMIGVGLATFFWLNTLSVIENSPRGSGLTSYATKLRAFPCSVLKRALIMPLRSFASSRMTWQEPAVTFLAGRTTWKRRPVTVVSSCLLLIPQVFVAASARWRFICALFLLAVGRTDGVSLVQVSVLVIPG